MEDGCSHLAQFADVVMSWIVHELEGISTAISLTWHEALW
jgi:hypothetical protein